MNRRYGCARFFAPDAGGSSGGTAQATAGNTAQAAATTAAQAATTAAQAQAPAEGAGQGQQATFTLEEVTRLIQSEADKRVTQALQRQQREYERKAQLSGLNDSERALAEKDDEITRLNDQLRELNGYKARSAVLTALNEAGLPASFADVITIDADPENAEVNAARVRALSEAFSRAVEAAVQQRLTGGKAPAAGGTAPAMTREQYQRLSLNEKQALAVSNPELYSEMNK